MQPKILLSFILRKSKNNPIFIFLFHSKYCYTLYKKKIFSFILMTKKQLLLQEVIAAVEKFHDAFGIENAYEPTLLDKSDSILRYKLMREENEEYLEACENNDMVEIADALGDMLYILSGTILKHGLQNKIEPVFEEIQRSNMSKLDENGNAIINDGIIDPTRPAGKVLKGENYTPPELKTILEM